VTYCWDTVLEQPIHNFVRAFANLT